MVKEAKDPVRRSASWARDPENPYPKSCIFLSADCARCRQRAACHPTGDGLYYLACPACGWAKTVTAEAR